MCILLVVRTSVAISSKKGIACQNLDCPQLTAFKNEITWFYNWKIAPDSTALGQCAEDLGILFVPMQWGLWDINNLPGNIPKNAQYLLAFNEPNVPSQSNLTPSVAAGLWKQVLSKISGRNLILGTPAVGGNGDYPFEWLDQFFGNCTGCKFDFMAAHYYICNVSELAGYLTSLYERYKLPIWLTEFACPLGTSTNSSLQIEYQNQAVDWLESQPFIDRYAWFTCFNWTDTWLGPTVNLLNTASPDELSVVGENYVALP